MLDSLKKIKEVEEKAVQRIEEARIKADNLLTGTSDQARQMMEKATEEARKESAQLMEKVCREAQSDAEKIVLQGGKTSTDIKKAAENRIEPATKIIISQIVGEA